MEPCDARLSSFDTILHYIDTAADLRSRSKIEFLHVLQHSFNRRWPWSGVYVSPCPLDLVAKAIIIMCSGRTTLIESLLSFKTGAPVTQYMKRWPADLAVPGSSSARGEIIWFYCTQPFIITLPSS